MGNLRMTREEAIELLHTVKLEDITWSSGARDMVFQTEESRNAMSHWVSHPSTTLIQVASVKRLVQIYNCAIDVLADHALAYKRMFLNNQIDTGASLEQQSTVDSLTLNQIGWAVSRMNYSKLSVEDGVVYSSEGFDDMILHRWCKELDIKITQPLADMLVTRDQAMVSWHNLRTYIKSTVL